MGERAIEAMVERGLQRTAFKRRIAEHGGFQQQLARARIRLDAARLTVLDAAHTLDRVGNKQVWCSSDRAVLAGQHPRASTCMYDAADQTPCPSLTFRGKDVCRKH